MRGMRRALKVIGVNLLICLVLLLPIELIFGDWLTADADMSLLNVRPNTIDVEPSPDAGDYWLTPKTKVLLVDAKHTNFDDNWKAFTAADREPRDVLATGVYNDKQIGLQVAVKNANRPESLRPLISHTALPRPTTASAPLSRYLNGVLAPGEPDRIALATWRACWIETVASPGSGRSPGPGT